jgi:hypothetical protein
MSEEDLNLLAIYAAVGVAIFLVILIALRKLRRFVKAFWARRQHDLDREVMRKKWARVQSLIDSPDPENDRLAIIEADKILDFVLTAMKMPGNGVAQKLQFATNKYYELKRVRWAHGLRNRIVHEEVRLNHREAKAAVSEFERALNVLGSL